MDPFVEALRARLQQVAPEIRRTWTAQDLERWWSIVKSEPGLSGQDIPEVANYIRGVCSDMFGRGMGE
jgi:hypothetical protein